MVLPVSHYTGVIGISQFAGNVWLDAGCSILFEQCWKVKFGINAGQEFLKKIELFENF